MNTETSQESENGGEGRSSTPYPPVRFASFPRRLGAIVYDLLAVAALWFGATAALLALVTGGEAIPPGTLYYPLLLAGLALAYFIISWHRAGQTLGMRAWGLVIAADDGAHPRAASLLARAGVAVLSLTALGLGFLWSLGRPDRRTWHDLASGTHLKRR